MSANSSRSLLCFLYSSKSWIWLPHWSFLAQLLAAWPLVDRLVVALLVPFALADFWICWLACCEGVSRRIGTIEVLNDSLTPRCLLVLCEWGLTMHIWIVVVFIGLILWMKLIHTLLIGIFGRSSLILLRSQTIGPQVVCLFVVLHVGWATWLARLWCRRHLVILRVPWDELLANYLICIMSSVLLPMLARTLAQRWSVI